MKRLNQTGSHIVALAVGILVVGLVGFAGYQVYQANQSSDTASAPVAANTTAPASIRTKADLTQAGKALDNSSAQLNSSLDDSSMNADLNSML